ncbi:ATPase [Marivirga lumbricoides]|uniref:ATPase n=1 Tax=Marivirga lumbricoides TaxID=1046115 RepID=A0A2T4DDU7_9BACT|nr:ATPase [Marivirga lumbricoides]
MSVKKIAIIGPESTGKSTLSEQLSHFFDEPFVPEFGRIYLEQHGTPYTYEDLLKISEGMLQLEQEKAKAAKSFLFCDTDLIMMKVWYEVKYAKVHPWIIEQLENAPYNYYLICKPDLPWIADPLRENPSIREALFKKYLENVNYYGIPYQIIKGYERLQSAVEALKKEF